MKGNVDLHIHTTASDGTCTPSRTVETAREMGLAAIAVTDHDTASGVSEAMVAGAKLGIEVIPGIEMSAEYEGRGVHIVGLFIDPAAASIRAAMDFAVRSRDRRNETILAAMNADGLDITADELRETFPGAVLGRPHIAQWLMRRGYTASVQESFQRYLSRGMPYYRPRARMGLAATVAAIRDAGGLAVIAHPLQYSFTPEARGAFIRAAMKAGCRALEAYYSGYGPEERTMLLHLAAQHGLAVSGGSDFHGDRKPDIRMGAGKEGEAAMPYAVLEALRAVKF